ncbi:MAG TPA: class I SAM-dependent methyltransferase, partial [Propionibacteriaceae bacterium]
MGPGHVTGVDRAADIVGEARLEARRRGVERTTFLPGDTYDLQFADDSFDVVARSPGPAAPERPGSGTAGAEAGLSARRAGGNSRRRLCGDDLASARPGPEPLDGPVSPGRPLGGRRARRRPTAPVLGVDKRVTRVKPTASVWCFADSEDLQWWSESWADRLTESDFGRQARERGLVDSSELESLVRAWRVWGTQTDAWFAVLH